MLFKSRKVEVENDWDYRSVPSIPFKNQRHSVDRAIFKLIYSKTIDEVDLKIQLRRARQLAYIEPWFQDFLPKQLKKRLFVSSLGKRFWLIGALDSLSANNFKFYQKEIRQTLENHLNNISHKEWIIPEFIVKVMPARSDVEAVAEDGPKAGPQLAVRCNKTMLANRSNRSLDDILQSMMKTAKKHG